MSGSGISSTICKSARWPSHITMPASHHSVCYRPDALPATQPTTSKHYNYNYYYYNYYYHVTALCQGLPGWDSIRRNIHQSQRVNQSSIILYLLPPSIVIHGILLVQFTCLTVSLHNLCPSFLWSTSWSGTLHFILNTFLHAIIVLFLQHMPIPSQPSWSYLPR